MWGNWIFYPFKSKSKQFYKLTVSKKVNVSRGLIKLGVNLALDHLTVIKTFINYKYIHVSLEV